MKKRVFYITENQKKELYRLVQEDSSNIAGIPSSKPEDDEEDDEDEYEVNFDDEDGEEDEGEEFI